MQIERTKLEVGCGNITHQCANNRLVRPFCRQQISPGCFGGAAVLPPKIEFPGQREIQLICARFVLTEKFRLRIAFIHGQGFATDGWQLVGTRDAQLRLGFEDSRCRNANIVILPESGVDQVLQLLVLKDLPPFLVSERLRRRGLRWFLRSSSTVHARNVGTWSLIVRPHSAARTQEHS